MIRQALANPLSKLLFRSNPSVGRALPIVPGMFLPERFAMGLVALGFCLGAASCSQDSTVPRAWDQDWNVLLVTLDSTRADRLGCYGHLEARTPVLDQLADEGIRFERAIASAPISNVAHASILSGCYPETDVANDPEGVHSPVLTPQNTTLSVILGSRGWRTAAFVSSYSMTELFGLASGYQSFNTGLPDSRSGLVDQVANRRSDQTTDEALTWLEQYGTSGHWHLWLHLADVQDAETLPPEDFANEFGVSDLNPESLGEWVLREELYDLEVAYVDQQLGRVVDYLKATGQYERTLIIVAGGNGLGLSDGLRNHAWADSGLLYDWSIRVPLILRLPEMSQPLVVPELVRTIDILPTVLEKLEIAFPASIDGRSLLPILRRELDEPRVAFAEARLAEANGAVFDELPIQHRDDLFVVTEQGWKLIHHANSPVNSELYDLLHDPAELHNLITEEPEEAARLRRILEMR
ncbi:MAG: arylsulfatase A-like enzyme [Planctomycetota bacterium]|jgi:arylsulfatase A-like enzyme